MGVSLTGARAAARIALGGALAGCSDASVPSPIACAPAAGELAPSPPGDSPRYDEVWQIATHNSYWVDRGAPGDALASGTQERLVDQVLVDHVRALEIDIHKDPQRPHAFTVHHTTPGNSLCSTLDGCLAELRAIHQALPLHEAITVVLELKEITEPNFDDEHTIEDLDRVLSDELGVLLYRPGDLLARCEARGGCAETLGTCAAARGWPPIDELRGRFVVALLGNWDAIGGQATRDWASYALRGPARDRSAFPMASSWKREWASLPPAIQPLVTQEELDAALSQSAMLQVEDVADPRLPGFLGRGGVVRIDGAFTPADQSARSDLGAQLLQTDFPWTQADDHGPSQPLRALGPGIDPSVLREPGTRAALLPAGERERVFAYLEDHTGSARWETAVAAGARSPGEGCLRAAAGLGAVGETSIAVCRSKRPADRGDGAGPGAPAADAEEVMLRVGVCAAGVCDWLSPAPGAEGLGDLVRLDLAGDGATTCGTAFSARTAGRDLVPAWVSLGPELCVGAPLPYQGIARPAASDDDLAAVHFVGTRRSSGDEGSDVDAPALQVVAEPPPDAADPAPHPAPESLVEP